jgi:acetyl esterase
MNINRIYDPEVEEAAAQFPRFDVKDALGFRDAIDKMLEDDVKEGFVRLRDDHVQEIEKTIPGPDGSPDVPIRVYMPEDRSEAGPGFVNFHGGGFIIGDLESEHPRCLTLASDGGAVSVGVDYRLAPEHPFPAGVEDCYAALKWVAANAKELKIDPARIAVGGGSAGGNLSAAVALMARDRGGPPVAFQMLIYPVVDDRCETPSMKCRPETYIWTHQNSLDMWDHYIGTDRSDVSPYAAPAREKDLSDLPPAYVMTCEHDPLRDEAILYAMRLMAAGVPVELHNYPGTVHGFDFHIGPSDIATEAANEFVEAFKRATSR